MLKEAFRGAHGCLRGYWMLLQAVDIDIATVLRSTNVWYTIFRRARAPYVPLSPPPYVYCRARMRISCCLLRLSLSSSRAGWCCSLRCVGVSSSIGGGGSSTVTCGALEAKVAMAEHLGCDQQWFDKSKNSFLRQGSFESRCGETVAEVVKVAGRQHA
jgi:hypothetical protein